MNIFDTIKSETALLNGRTAIIEGLDRISYGELFLSAEVVSAALREYGVSQYHRVGLLCGDCIDYVIASLAVMSLSAVVVPVSHELSSEEIATVIERIDLDFVISENSFLPDDRYVPLRSRGFHRRGFSIVKRTDAKSPPPEFFHINPAFIRFTSGTTGSSKGVVLSHEAILERLLAADRGVQITADDTVLWVLSMSYHFVVSILLYLLRGATVVLCGQRFPDALIEGVVEHRGTFIYASPFHYNLLAHSDRLNSECLRHVRMAVSTAMKLPEQVAGEFYGKFGLELAEAYGIIEIGLPFIRIAGGCFKRGSVGKALPDYDLMLANTDTDGTGEILLKGKGMLDAYYSPWMSVNDILCDGWFRTGDYGRIDSDGFLFITGRCKDVINFAGMKIFAQEVEEVINRHPKVLESLVYGVRHSRFGELPTAKIVPKDLTDLTVPDDLKGFCYQRMSPFKVPKDFQIVERLTKTASGKIKR